MDWDGVMGQSMCSHLIDAGYSVTLYTRTPSKADTLVDKGATFVRSPIEVSQASEVVFSIVGFPEDVESVLLGEDGAIAGCKPGTIFVDMTTSRPSLAEKIADTASSRNAFAVDAPVSGGDLGARNATLSIMIGGDPEPVETIMPLLELMGKTLVHQGGPDAVNTRKW